MWITRVCGWIGSELDVIGLRCSCHSLDGMAYMRNELHITITMQGRHYDIADSMYKR
jgi:hypothetical protein